MYFCYFCYVTRVWSFICSETFWWKTENNTHTNYIQDILINFSGPFVNILISIFCYFLNVLVYSPKLVDITAVNAVLGIYNLLPFYNFDGGKILEILLKIKLSKKLSEDISTTVSILILIPFIYFSFTIFFQNKSNFYFIIVTLLMLLAIILKK